MGREQRPQIEGNWLYKEENGKHSFASVLTLPEEEPDWLECTTEQKIAWEAKESIPQEEVEQ